MPAQRPVINDFHGKYRFLSNFWPVSVEFEGLVYPSTEAAYQAAKFPKHERERFTRYSPADAKHAGSRRAEAYGFSRCTPPPTWDSRTKFDVMKALVRTKFTQNEDMKRLLLETGDAILIEGNTWHDNTWGDCSCPRCKDKHGINYLGQLLMEVRKELNERQNK